MGFKNLLRLLLSRARGDPHKRDLEKQSAESPGNALTLSIAKRLFRARLEELGTVTHGKIDFLTEAVFGKSGWDKFKSFQGGVVLSLAEKKHLGLNTRSKYWVALVECFDSESFRKKDPKDVLMDALYGSWFAAYREEAITNAIRAGRDSVVVSSMNPCECYPKMRYGVNELPPFPHKNCPLRRCTCSVRPVVPGWDD